MEEQNADNRKPSKAMVSKLMEINGMRASLKTFVRSAVENASEIFLKNLDEGKKEEFVERLINDNDYVDAFSGIYAEYFTANEVLDLISFCRSPTGQKMTSLQATIAQRLIDATQELIGNTYVKIMAKAMHANFKVFRDQLEELGIEDDLDEEEK